MKADNSLAARKRPATLALPPGRRPAPLVAFGGRPVTTAGAVPDARSPDPERTLTPGLREADSSEPCRQLCHQCYEVVSDPARHADCFGRSFSFFYRLRLERGQAGGGARKALLDWCADLESGSGTRQTLERLAGRGLSDWRLFHELVQQRQETRCFSAATQGQTGIPGADFERLVCSPDSRYIAGESVINNPGEFVRVSIWRHDEGAVHKVGQFSCEVALESLQFGAGSQSLYALDTLGRRLCWEPDASTVWRLAQSETLFRQTLVDSVCYSPDGGYIAVSLLDCQLEIFDQTAAGNWRQCFAWQQAGPTSPSAEPESGSRLEIVGFSEGNRTLVFTTAGPRHNIHLCRRGGRLWRVNTMMVTSQRLDSVVLASGGQLLALALRRSEAEAGELLEPFRLSVTLQLWRCDMPRGWHCVSAQTCYGADSRFAMALSPDDRFLACPASHLLEPGLCILSTRCRDATPEASAAAPVCSLPMPSCHQLQFSPDSRFLAIVESATTGGLTVLHEAPGQSWITVLRLENRGLSPWPCRPAQLVFTPDGQHCALATRDTCSVWGLYSDRGQGLDYRCKLHLGEGASVERLLFTPDGTRLWILRSPAPGHADRQARLSCLRLAPGTEHSVAGDPAMVCHQQAEPPGTE